MATKDTKNTKGVERVEGWFRGMGRRPFAFQREAWGAYLAGRSGLIQAPTGMGKTLAAGLGCVIEWMEAREKFGKEVAPITLIWMTPLRALASDTVNSLLNVVQGLGLPWRVELRTSDTTQTMRRKQKEKLPTVLVTTPESLSVLLSYTDAPERFGTLKCVVVDEWHELMGSKRGVQAELGLARLRTLSPGVRTWGLSATMANVEEAMRTLVGVEGMSGAALVKAEDVKAIVLDSVLPEKMERFPWAGHLGLHLAEEVAENIAKARSSLVFTNTRSQAELWFRKLMEIRPEWLGKIALHHGSIDRKIRQRVEQMLRDGELLAVVCTASLDLGVDFWPVDQVIQIGSPKSIARTMQRAGRSGHQPGAKSRILCVPTQALEVVEFSAARHAIAHRHLEIREPVMLALDVLAQHVVTVAAGGGFDAEALFHEVKGTHAFSEMTREQWQWVMDFAEKGGATLAAYPRFRRIKNEGGKWVTATEQLARMHRMNIGTITADGAVAVQIVRGKRLGMVEESFAAKLLPGDVFSFAGRTLEFVRLHQMTAQVRSSKRKKGTVPRWMGGRLPLSSSLAAAFCLRLDQAAGGDYVDAEMGHVKEILELQKRWSHLPRLGELLMESTTTRDGFHLYLFPFQGRLVHEGLAALVAYRLGLQGFKPITATFNDYGIEFLSPMEIGIGVEEWLGVLSPENLAEDILSCINSGELARRHFREIARIAGLLVTASPGAPRSVRALQASSELFFEVFREFDPGNLLLEQARREVLERQLEFARLRQALEHIRTKNLLMVETKKLSPLAFPLWAERIASQQLRFEKAGDRIERLAKELESAAGKE